jgi:hypothetical protein
MAMAVTDLDKLPAFYEALTGNKPSAEELAEAEATLKSVMATKGVGSAQRACGTGGKVKDQRKHRK